MDLSKAVTIEYGSAAYPTEWLGISDAPKTLYAFGNVALLQERKFCIVGSRRTPQTALKTGAKISKALSRAFVVVSGTADGGDMAAIEGALAGSGKIICMLAGGFSTLPQANVGVLQEVAKRGLLLSPYPHETSVRTFSYEYRNKLLAALCDGVLVLGAAEKSGALITAKYAKKYGKKVFALPYAPGAAAGVGCNALIKDGGFLTESEGDVLEGFGIELLNEPAAVTLTADEEKMHAALRELSEGHVNELSAKSGIPAFKARAVLSALEVKGLAVSLGGNRYAAV